MAGGAAARAIEAVPAALSDEDAAALFRDQVVPEANVNEHLRPS